MTNEEIVELKNEVEEVGYYDLVRVTPTHGSTFHIPAPFFFETQRRIDFVFALPVAEDLRGNDYYSCPECGARSFFSGLCGGCQYDLTSLRYRNHEALKRASKAEFLRRLDQGIPDLGISSAEFVMTDPSTFPCWDVEEDEEEEDEVDEGRDEEEARRQVRYHTHEELAKQIEVEKENCRQVNGVWQHKHEGHDYWHLMAGVHRKQEE